MVSFKVNGAPSSGKEQRCEAQVITNEICEQLQLAPVELQQLDDFYMIFKRDVLQKPLILILDEFDSLAWKIALQGLG